MIDVQAITRRFTANSSMKSIFSNSFIRLGAILLVGIAAKASTVSVTFLGAPTGVNDGTYYVLPYQLSIAGSVSDATCYDIYDDVVTGQNWTASELTLNQAAATGMFSANPNALEGYKQVGFFSQQATTSDQNQIDLQHDIWNVFAPNTYSVTTGMQAYLDLLTGSEYSGFDFNRVLFLEDTNQMNRAQAFVVQAPAEAPEPTTIALMAAGTLLIGISRIKRRSTRKIVHASGSSL